MGLLIVRFYQDLLAAPSAQFADDTSKFFPTTIFDDVVLGLKDDVLDDEIQTSLFSISNNKALGPDGFTSLFFKRSWDIVGIGFKVAVRYFIDHCILPRYVNATRISLMPKVETAYNMNDFKTISCCKVLYKCISKIIVRRLKVVLFDVIG